MARLLDRTTLAEVSGNAAYLDSGTYGNARIAAVLSAVDAMVARYLHFVPWLQQTSGEEGITQYLEAGDYAGRYLLTLQNRPLVPGTPAQIITDLELRYALTSMSPSVVNLTYAQVDHGTARVYALAPGAIDALLGSSVAFGVGAMRGLRATSYVASYWSGWLTGVGTDPTPPVGVTPNPIPEDIQMAAALLAQEFLTYQAAQAQQSASSSVAVSGLVTQIRVGEREQTYQPVAGRSAGQATLGYGSPLSVTAAGILDQYRKRPAPVLVG